MRDAKHIKATRRGFQWRSAMKAALSLPYVGALSMLALLISGVAAQAAGGRVVTPSGRDTESCGTAVQLSESVSRAAPKSDQNSAALKLVFLLSAVRCFCGPPGED